MAALLDVTHQRNLSWQLIAASELPPRLDPLISDWLCRSAATLAWLTDMYGSPLNIVWPHTVASNLSRMAAVAAEFAVESQFYYGVKASQSQALLQAAAQAGAGADVSSRHELHDALRAGCRGQTVCATGPVKTAGFLHELIQQHARIVVDSLEELQQIIRLAGQRTEKAARVNILLRFRPDASRLSRFGMPAAQIIQALPQVAACQQIHLAGFHFHLSGYSPATRVAAFFATLPFFTSARNQGLSPDLIDIGGGLPVQYLDSQRYQHWLASQSPDDYRTGVVPSSFYPYGGELNAAQWLKLFLQGQNDCGQTVADCLRQQELTLCLEPGRSLVDQAAISVFRVQRVSAYADQHAVIFVEGSSFSACETWFNSEFLIDPLLIRAGNRLRLPGKAWIAGHSCLDEDVLTNRFVAFQQMPQAGDLLVFVNTAGYQMDLLENHFHRYPAPVRLTAVQNPAGNLIFSIDQ